MRIITFIRFLSQTASICNANGNDFKHALRLAAIVATLSMPSTVFANDNDIAIFSQLGDGESRTRSVTAGVSSNFRNAEATAEHHWDVLGEVEIGTWYEQGQSAPERRFFTEAGVTPVLRFTFANDRRGLFVDAGIGVHAITPHYVAGKRRFSTIFNFGDHVGIGGRFGEAAAHEVSMRVQHFSNAGIKNPNPGMNYLQFRYAYHF